MNLPPNVRIMFEVEHLKYATLATVSRCGMIWFSEDVIDPPMVYRNYLDTLSSVALDADDEDAFDNPSRRADTLPGDSSVSPNLVTQRNIVAILEPFFRRRQPCYNRFTFCRVH